MSENVPTPEEGELAAEVGRELDPRAFDRARFYNDMEYGLYQHRHMYQIDKVVSSTAFRDWLAARDRENRAIGWDEGAEMVLRAEGVENVANALANLAENGHPNPYRGDNR